MSLAVARREWDEQVLLATLLDRWIDPTTTFATAVDNVAASAMAGAMRRLRGVKRGLPDVLLWHRARSTVLAIAIELKSPSGRCTAAQNMVREQLLQAGCTWWEARSANAALVAIVQSGVKLRNKVINEDGTVERWKKPQLANWEVPRRDPSEPRPQHPDVAAQRRAARQQWRVRQRAREAAKLAAANDEAAGDDIASLAASSAE